MKKYIDIKKNALKVVELNIEFDSDDFARLFYDSIIINSMHTRNSIGVNCKDKIYFEILLQYFDEVIALDFDGVTEVESESSLSIFPEIRSINISLSEKEKGMKCKFTPMWSDKTIQFYFDNVKMVSYLIDEIERGEVLGTI